MICIRCPDGLTFRARAAGTDANIDGGILARHHVISYTGGVGRGTGVGRGRGVAVGLCGGGVAVAQGVPNAWHQVIRSVSTRQPSLLPLVSLAIRHRSLLEV